MNFLSFIFSLLLLISFGIAICMQKAIEARRIQSTSLGHLIANRYILSEYEKETFQSLRTVRKSKTTKEKKKEPSAPSVRREKEETDETSLSPNPLCARLNLWPLIQEGREHHPLLYDATAKLLKTFYEPLFEKQSRFEFRFLDAWLAQTRLALTKETPFAPETVSFPDPAMQACYYKMLKGTKKCQFLKEGIGYPSLLDLIKVEPVSSKPCLAHAHPYLFAALFSPKIAMPLFYAIHRDPHPPPTPELIEQICGESHLFLPDRAIFELLEFGRPRHKKGAKTTLVAEDEDTHISLKKTVFLGS